MDKSLAESETFAARGSDGNTHRHFKPTADQNLTRVLTAGLFATMAVVLTVPFFSSLPWTTLVQDDFFYYLVVAQNIVHGHGSTFNGIVPTNGYQPLWLWVILGLSAVTENPKLILGFVAVTSLAASAVTFFLVQRLIARTAVRPLLVFALTACITVMSFLLYCQGMEVTLALPALFGVLCMLQEVEWLKRSKVHTFYLGLLLSAMVLSRIDTLIIGGLLLAGMLASRVHRRLLRWELLAGLASGLTPVLLYFMYNHAVFGTWLPVSGMAKQLRIDHRPSMLPLHFLLHRPSPVLVVGLVIVLAALMRVIPESVPRLTEMQRVICVAAVAFPFVYYGTLSFLSDWRIWPWYWYALRPASCVLCVLFCLSTTSARFLERTQVAWAIVLAAFVYLCHAGWPRQQADIAEAAESIHRFAETHPGVYAMGDRSGQVAYRLPYPMVQTEGLMMDRSYLDYLKNQTPLRKVLAAYRVRYYVATETGVQPCFDAVEPYQAGPYAPHLRDRFCEPPAAVFPEGRVRTVVYDLGPQ